MFAIDALNNSAVSSRPVVDSRTEETITIVGWAVDARSREAAAAVFVSIDGVDVPAVYRQERKDVATVHGNEKYAASGFVASFPTSLIGRGKHVLSLKIVTAGKDGYFQPEQGITFEVR